MSLKPEREEMVMNIPGTVLALAVTAIAVRQRAFGFHGVFDIFNGDRAAAAGLTTAAGASLGARAVCPFGTFPLDWLSGSHCNGEMYCSMYLVGE